MTPNDTPTRREEFPPLAGDWYEDRNFPEIKGDSMSGPNIIVAVVDDEAQRRKLIRYHNRAMAALREHHKAQVAALEGRATVAERYTEELEAKLAEGRE